MRKFTRRRALQSFTIFLFLNLLITFFDNIDFDNAANENSVYNFEKPKNAYFNNSLSPIYIDGAATGVGAHNWDWALSKPWCNLVEGAYVIENVVINNPDQENCIFIENSNVFFIVKNCSVLSSGVGNAGIKLKNTNNSLLINNNFSSKNVGIYLDNSHFNEVSNNIAFYNVDFGIYLRSNSGDNTIKGNDLSFNGNNGIRLQSACKRNEIQGNSILNNTLFGIYVHYADVIDKPRYNLFCLNNVSGNNGNAIDYGINNNWDDGSFGNYWGDYAGSDSNGDGIGDIPYDIALVSQDHYPLMADWIPPELPGEFLLTSNAGNPDNDGIFNLTWMDSHGADNYSVYSSDKQILKIDENLKVVAYQNATSPWLISGMETGRYYFVVVAYNDSGEVCSNNKYIVVQLPGDGPLPNGNENSIDANFIAIIIISISTASFLSVIINHKIKGKILIHNYKD